MTKEDAIATGCVGPIARACGVDYDVRKDYPYSIYPELEFDVPVGTTGDCYDRYLVRIEELKQSIRILRQCLKQIPDGPVMVDDPRVALPPKRDTYNTIESMIRHFKHIIDGIKVPAGEAYAFVEGGNGELGFFVVADGTGRPYKAYVPVAVVRAPVDGGPADPQPPDRGHRPDLRHDQHDRRGVRQVSTTTATRGPVDRDAPRPRRPSRRTPSR